MWLPWKSCHPHHSEQKREREIKKEQRARERGRDKRARAKEQREKKTEKWSISWGTYWSWCSVLGPCLRSRTSWQFALLCRSLKTLLSVKSCLRLVSSMGLECDLWGWLSSRDTGQRGLPLCQMKGDPLYASGWPVTSCCRWCHRQHARQRRNTHRELTVTVSPSDSRG